MFVRELPCFFDVVGGEDLPGKIRLCNVLQSGNLRVIEKAAARANIGIDEARVRRVLPPMRELVAIGIEDRIEAKRLNRRLLENARSSRRDRQFRSRGSSRILIGCAQNDRNRSPRCVVAVDHNWSRVKATKSKR
jgi:hypothetical protein